MKVGEAEKYIKENLQAFYDDSEAANIAWLVIENCTGLDRTTILVNKEQEITEIWGVKILFYGVK